MLKVKTVRKPKPKIMAKPVKKAILSRDKIEESIRLKAYELYLQRNGQGGDPYSDWLKAEKMILQA